MLDGNTLRSRLKFATLPRLSVQGGGAVVDASKSGTNWRDDELDAIVADYFAMLSAEQSGASYVKSHHARALMERIGRSHRSVEFKHMNLSAVLGELGLPTIRGYRPMANYQAAIFDAVERYLTGNDEAWTIGAPPPLGDQARPPGMAEAPAPFTAHPLEIAEPPSLHERHDRPAGLQRLVRKFDPAARDARNRALGRLGEQSVYDHEIARLIGAERMDLARRVEWTSEERGDGAGYDIRSFDPTSGQELFIEVKTTRGGPRTDFFLSRNERAFSDEEPDRFRLYRLYDAASDMKLFALKPPLEAALRLSPETWRAGF